MSEKCIAIREMARENGLCDEWYNKWTDDLTDDELLNMYVKGIDFSIGNDWISNEFAKENFDEDTLAEHGIFIDHRKLFEENAPVLILNGHCKGRADYFGFQVGNVYVRDESEVNITVDGMARCFVEVYDNAVVNVVNNSGNKVFVYRHGGKVTTTGNVLVREKC